MSVGGTTHFEDGFGGLISGPLGFWKHGEIYVYKYQRGPNREIMLHNFQNRATHWNNGNPDKCLDAQIFIGAQKTPQQHSDQKFIEVITGFLDVKCNEPLQHGYLTWIMSLTHGGPLIGRVYKAVAEFDVDDFPHNVSSCSIYPKVTLTEIGAILEDRDVSSSAHYQVLLALFFIPHVLWFMMFIRLSSVSVTLTLAITSSAMSGGSSSVQQDSSARSDASDGSTTGTSENRKEKVLSKYINSRVIQLWKKPVLHIMYIVLYIFIEQIMREDEGIIHNFISTFDWIHIDYALHAIALCSQELVSWGLSIYSSFVSNKKGWDMKQKALIYTYQHSETSLGLIKLLNVSLSLMLLLKALDVLDDELGWILIPGTSALIVLCEATMVMNGFQHHPFEHTPACAVGKLSDGFSIMTRQISNYLASQQMKGLKGFTRSPNYVPGMEYIGTLGDVLTLSRPDYVLEGLINGQVIQIAIIETPCKDNVDLIKFECVGNHQFTLVRHWLQQGKQNIAML